MSENLRKIVHKRWKYILIFICVVLLVVNILIFYPGYMSSDTLRNLNQAKGVSPFIDLQPVILPIIWRVLILISGSVASMLFLQLIILWLSIAILSIIVYQKTARKSVSLIPIAVGLAPFIINISGVIWSDNHLAFCLLFAVVVALLSENEKFSKKRLSLLFIALIFIFYAGMVRNNSVLATIPILYLIVEKSKIKLTSKKKIFATFCLFVSIILASFIIRTVLVKRHITNTAGPMMDDIVHILNVDEINNSEAPAQLKASLVKLHQCVQKEKNVIDAFPCGEEQDKTNVLILFPNEVKDLWKWTLTNRPLEYIQRRITVFIYVIFPPEGRGYIWHDGVDSNMFGIDDKFKGLGEINRMYVYNFGYKHFQYLYEPWFWLFLNTALLFYARKLKELSIYVYAVSSSALLYIATFIPTGIAADYRYIYWPVIAGLLSLVLVITDKYLIIKTSKPVRKSKNKK